MKTENFNILQNLNLVNELIEKTNVTNDLFDYMQSIHSVNKFKWTINDFENRLQKNINNFEDQFSFGKNIKFKFIFKKTDNSMWKICIQLLTPNLPHILMWFQMKNIDNDDNENNSIIQNGKFNFK